MIFPASIDVAETDVIGGRRETESGRQEEGATQCREGETHGLERWDQGYGRAYLYSVGMGALIEPTPRNPGGLSAAPNPFPIMVRMAMRSFRLNVESIVEQIIYVESTYCLPRLYQNYIGKREKLMVCECFASVIIHFHARAPGCPNEQQAFINQCELQVKRERLS